MRTRTTLTLDPDVAAMIEREVLETDLPFKQVVNQKLRIGFAAAVPAKKFSLPKPLKLGRQMIPNLDNIGGVLDLISEYDRT